MKIILLIFLFPFIFFSQSNLRDSVLVKTSIYTVMYSEKFENPLWVEYVVLCPLGKASRNGMDFYLCDSIKTSDNADYVNNVWDKGHMAPAACFNCNKDMLYQTFSYLNCSLQNQYLNRGVWKTLEMQEKIWGRYQAVKVRIVVEYKNPKKLPTGATVPSGFYKTIYLVGSKELYKYYFPNQKPTTTDISKYLIK